MSIVVDGSSQMAVAIRKHESNEQLSKLRRSWEGNLEVAQVCAQPHFGRILVVLKDKSGYTLLRYWPVPDYGADPNGDAFEFAVSADGDGVDFDTVLSWLNDPKAVRKG
ncbi:MAG: hypothetical protein KDB22_01100 [Planctomycetales bacterium]|nr:hypothetical protein [Planctomycetales bacterium]